MDLLEEIEGNTQISPIVLEQLIYETNLIGECKKEELLFVVIMIIINETNFTLVNRDMDTVNSITESILSARESKYGCFDATFICDNFDATPVKIVASVTGDVMIFNAILFDVNNETYSVCLPISRYVESCEPIKLRELRDLMLRIKDNILNPIKCSVLNHHGRSSGCLKGLPEELLLKISLNLSVCDIVNLGKTCRRLYSFLNDEGLWYHLCKRDLKNEDFDQRSDWKDLYKDKFLASLEESRRNRTSHPFRTMHEFMDFADYVSYVDPAWETFT